MCIHSDTLAQAVQNLIERNLLKLKLGDSASPEMLELANKNINDGKLELNKALQNHIIRERKLVAKKIYDALSEEPK